MGDKEISALVAQAQRDPAAFGALYDHYVKAVYRYHANRVGDAEDAQDLTAQTFLAALEALPRYRHRGTFATWLFQIARSKAYVDKVPGKMGGGVYVARPDGTDRRLLVQLEHWGIRELVWSPDGQWLLAGILDTDQFVAHPMAALVNVATCQAIP